MKAVQKKQTITNNGTQKLPKNTKAQNVKKTKETDIVNGMVFSEYDVWPILSELYKNQN
jgi:hypothetical protein